ncbi:Hypothetical predicted protein [Mytilus galloprovincialis]|uniref:Uncharacterized protein n=1 Tax=Mytilus galloprovincialis TaxID=29158 RepID=A0A8B6F335_MYTGA|nr:Hypothetical predicted protein [Mytilus galloprovincialis]
MNFTQIDDSDLDLTLGQIIKEFPLCGETLLQQMLLLKGIRVQRWRLRECMHRLDTAGVQARRTGQLQNAVGITEGEANLQDYGIEGYVDQNDVEEGERPIFGPLAHMISDQMQAGFNSTIDKKQY